MRKFRERGALAGMGADGEARAVVKRYNRVAAALVDFELRWEHAWRTAAETARRGLAGPLLGRRPVDGSLFVNFDSSVLQVSRAHCHMLWGWRQVMWGLVMCECPLMHRRMMWVQVMCMA